MTDAPRQFDVIVLGAGAAGLMCAAVAGQRGRRVALLEHNGQVGRKILISGGGRCNFTNLHCGPGNFISENMHFAKSALALYEPRHFIELVERYGIAWHEKTLGQLFCDGSARAILDMLLAECERGSVEVVLNARGIEATTGGFGDPSGGFSVECTQGRFWAEALVPLVLGGDEAGWTKLAGVAAEAVAEAGGARFREKMLVTHRGLSGPAVLQASSYWRPGEELVVDFGPELDLLGPLMRTGARRDAAALKQALREVLPQRLAGFLAEAGVPEGWSNAALEACERRLHRWVLHPAGTEGFEKAEVTAGGVDTDGLQAQTMEARAVPGLFFIGEAVDVTGQLGGFNFQWAWASGVAAGRSV